jgi:mycothiol synthase
MSNSVTVRRFVPGDEDPVRAIIERASADGELVGFNRSEVREWLNSVPDDGAKTWVAELGGKVIGFLSVGNDALIVSPPHRRKGAGRALVAAALNAHPELEISQWSGSAETAAFLDAVGFRLHHHLLRLIRTGSTLPQERETPPGFELVGYRPESFDAYVALIRDSFADHPTPLHLDKARIRTVHERTDFDPGSIGLIAIEGDARRLVAFVRLRSAESDQGTPRGAIALLGVHPGFRGRGFARQLLRWGIRCFIEQGIDEIEIEVVTGNDRALPLYASEGFVEVQSWPYWIPQPIHSS